MANSAVRSVTSAGQSAGRVIGDALGGVGNVAGKTAARTREGAEDIWADAKDVANKGSIPGNRADTLTYVGLATTAAVGLVEWPLAAALGAGYALVRRSNRKDG